MIERLRRELNENIVIHTICHIAGYSVHKGTLTYIDDEYLEMDCRNKTVIIPINNILHVEMK